MAPKKYKQILLDVSIHLRYLRQDLHMQLPELCDKYPQYPRTSIWRHSKMPIGEQKVDKRKESKGRPRKLTERDERKLTTSLSKLRESVGGGGGGGGHFIRPTFNVTQAFWKTKCRIARSGEVCMHRGTVSRNAVRKGCCTGTI